MHTPGPWKLSPWITSQGKAVYRLVGGHGRTIASVSVYGKHADGKSAGRRYRDECGRDGCVARTVTQQECDDTARLIVAAPDMDDQLVALLLLGWEVEKRSLYDEEGVEGWAWIEPNGDEHVDVGPWDELPPWPKSARVAIAKAEKGG